MKKLLITPDKKVLRIQLQFFSLLSFTFLFMLFFIIFPLTNGVEGQDDTFGSEKIVFDILAPLNAPLALPLFSLRILDLIVLIIGIISLIEILFFWSPSYASIAGKESIEHLKGTMKEVRSVWHLTKFIFPERYFLLRNGSAQILIRRKRSSLRGILLREFILETHLNIPQSQIKQIADFTGVEKIVKTATHSILLKCVNIKHLPLQIIQIRAILAVIKK